MTVNFLYRIGKAVPIFGFFIISACFSSQSLAAECYFQFYPPRCNLGALPEYDLTINQATPDPIDFAAAIDISKLNGSSTYQIQASIHDDSSELIDDLIKDKLITLSNGITFHTYGWSAPFYANVVTIVYNIPFIKTELVRWVGNGKAKKLSIYAYIRAYYKSSSPYLGRYLIDWYSEIPINVAVEDFVLISRLKDIELPQNDNNPMRFCVTSTTEKVRLKFKADNSPSRFQLQASDDPNNAYTIGYNITLGGTKNDNPKNIRLQRPGTHEGHKWDAHKAELSDIACNGDNNMWILIDFNDQNEASTAPAGKYIDTIEIAVSAA